MSNTKVVPLNDDQIRVLLANCGAFGKFAICSSR